MRGVRNWSSGARPHGFSPASCTFRAFPGGSGDKESACNVGDLGLTPGLGRSPEEGNGHPLQYQALRIPWTEEPGGLQFTGSQRIRHDWATNTSNFFFLRNPVPVTFRNSLRLSKCQFLFAEEDLPPKAIGKLNSVMSIRRWAQGLPNPHHHLAARVAASEGWILVRTCPSRWWGSPPVPTSPLERGLLLCTLAGLFPCTRSHTQPTWGSVVSRLHLLHANLWRGTAPGDTPTAGSVAGWVTGWVTPERPQLRASVLGGPAASFSACRNMLKGMQAEFLEHSQVLLTWLLCFLNITTRYRVVQQEGSSPREAPSKPHSVLAVSCSLPLISSQQRLYQVFPLPWGDWELYSDWNQMGTHGWSLELAG